MNALQRQDSWPGTKRPLPWIFALFLASIFLLPVDATQLKIHLPFSSEADRFFAAGVIAAWAITVYALEVDYSIDVGLIAMVILFTVALTIATGAATTWGALSTRPAQYLRTE